MMPGRMLRLTADDYAMHEAIQFRDLMPDLHRTLDRQERPAEGEQEMQRQKPPGPRAERRRAEPLQPAEVDCAAPVDAGRPHRQFAVGPQKWVAAEPLPRAGQVWHLELIARHRVAQIAERQEPAGRYPVEQLL